MAQIIDLKVSVVRHICSETEKGNITWSLGVKELSHYGMWGKRELRLGWIISRYIPCLRLTCLKGQYSISGFEPSVRDVLLALKHEVRERCEQRLEGREDMVKAVQNREKARTKRGQRDECNPVLLEFLSEQEILRAVQQ